MSHETPEESLKAAMATLGDEYGKAFHHGLQELWRVSSRWDQYETLFDEEGKVDFLNATGSYFWRNIQDTLFEAVMLGLCRLTDPVKSAGRANLTVRRFPLLDTSIHRKSLEELVDLAVSSTKVSRDWRNRKLAHNDLEKITQAAPLPGATRVEVTASIDAIHEVFRWISSTHREVDLLLTQLGDNSTKGVLETLYCGRQFLNAEKKEHNWRSRQARREAAPKWLYAPSKKRYRDALC